MSSEIQIFSKYTEKTEDNDICISHRPVHSYPIHGHVYYEILVYDPFKGEITLNNSHFDPSTPTAIMITPNDFHSVSVQMPAPPLCYKLQIKRSIMEQFSDFAFTPTVTQNHERVAFLRSLCEQACKNVSDHEFLLTSIKLVALTMQKSTGKISFGEKSLSLIRKATDIIIERFQSPITLEGVAEELHVSPQHLSNLFSKYADMSFIEYLTDRRLNYAKRAMLNGSNVTEACFQSGYRNLSHFIRSFKRKYGITPASFIKEHRPSQNGKKGQNIQIIQNEDE